MRMKLFLIVTLFTIISINLLNALTLNPTSGCWWCHENDFLKKGWWVLEDRNGDGIYDTETTMMCKGALDTHPLPRIGMGVVLGTAPQVDNPSHPEFFYDNTGWVIIQSDSSIGVPIYSVIHTYNPDTTYIELHMLMSEGKEISYLEGEHPNILNEIIIKPNPPTTGDSFEVIFKPATTYTVNVSMSNIEGALIYRKQIKIEKDIDSKLLIDVSDYPVGAYFINFKAEGLSSTKKIIINR